jgi:hypothetical protein
MKPSRDVFADVELVDLLADEPELLAIADAIAATQPRTSRLRRPILQRRLIAIAAACIVAVTAIGVSPVGGTIAHAGGYVFDELSSWVSGSPGEPAGDEAKKAFERENLAALVSFPRGTNLRSLSTVDAEGYRFELLGFRTGDSVCLRLVVSDVRALAPASCVLLRQLVAGPPVSVVTSDIPFGIQDVQPTEQGDAPPIASATFGFAKDGVASVEVRTDDGAVRLPVQSNTFLFVASAPTLGSRVRSVDAIDAQGNRTPVPFAPSSFGEDVPPTEPVGVPGGPDTVERVVSRGSITWIKRHEERGEALPDQLAQDLFVHEVGARVLFGRALRPDPDSSAAIAVVLLAQPTTDGVDARTKTLLCISELRPIRGGGGGCGLAGSSQWDQGVFGIGGLSEAFSGDQFVSWFGLVSDEVAHLDLYPASGLPFAVPLKDNVFLLDLHETAFPAKLVAFDAESRVIGIQRNPGIG